MHEAHFVRKVMTHMGRQADRSHQRPTHQHSHSHARPTALHTVQFSQPSATQHVSITASPPADLVAAVAYKAQPICPAATYLTRYPRAIPLRFPRLIRTHRRNAPQPRRAPRRVPEQLCITPALATTGFSAWLFSAPGAKPSSSTSWSAHTIPTPLVDQSTPVPFHHWNQTC